MRYAIAIGAVLFCSSAGLAQLQVISQRITLNYPQSAQEILQPTTFGTVSRQGQYTDTVLGGSAGGSGTIQIAGSATATTSWDGSLLSWTNHTYINCQVLDPFELDDYAEVSQQARTRVELRFDVTSPITVLAMRSPLLFGQNSGAQAFCNFSLPSVRAVDSQGQVIQNSGFIIDSLAGEQYTLEPGSYVALLTSQSLFLSGSFGSPPSAGEATVIDGASLQIVPAPATIACLAGAGLLAARRRR
ncbi:MAG: hypothetical protein U0640_11190 [Phycisphaerales bacterium]